MTIAYLEITVKFKVYLNIYSKADDDHRQLKLMYFEVLSYFGKNGKSFYLLQNLTDLRKKSSSECDLEELKNLHLYIEQLTWVSAFVTANASN